MGAALDHPAPVKHQDLVAIPYGGEPVRDDHAGAAPASDGPAHLLLHEGVQGAGGFVQKEERGVHGQGAGDFKTLALSSAEIGPGFLHPAPVAARPGGHVVVDAGVPGGPDHVLFRKGFVPHRQVVPHGADEKKDALVHRGHGIGHHPFGDGTDRLAVVEDLAGPGGVQAGAKLGDGGFARAAGSDQGHPGPGGHLQAEVLDERRIKRAVAEGHVPHLEVPDQLARALPGRIACFAQGGQGRVQRIAEHVVQALQVGPHGLELAAQVDHLVDRTHEVARKPLEGGQHADGQLPVDNKRPPEAQQQHLVKGGEQPRDHREHLGGLVEFLAGVTHLRLIPGPLGEMIGFRARGLQGFDHLQAVHGHAHELAHVLLQAAVGVGALGRDEAQGHQVGQGGRHADAGELPTVVEHDHGVQEHGHNTDRGRGQRTGEESCHLVVELDAAADISRIALVEKIHRQAQEMPKEFSGTGQDHARLQAQQQFLLDKKRRSGRRRRQGHGPQQRRHPFLHALAQDVIEKNNREGGAEDARQREQRPGQDNESQGVFRGCQATAQAGVKVGFFPAGGKMGTRHEGQGDAGK